MAKIFESHGLGDAAGVRRRRRRTPRSSTISIRRPRDLEGYLFPETYALPRQDSTPDKLVALMVTRFEHVFTPELRQAAAARNLSVRQAVTLALDRREGDGPARRASADRRRVHATG